jgi:hypothetical protein
MSSAHRDGMPIAARQPGSRPESGARSGDEPSIGDTPPPGALLPSGGSRASAPVPAPHRALALDALRVQRTLRDRPRDAGLWGEPAFAREVDLVRGQLAPIRSRRGLAASWSREAFQRPRAEVSTDGLRDGMALDAVRIAYTVRWLELGDGRSRPAWSDLVAGRA